jgi:hypothetical protein
MVVAGLVPATQVILLRTPKIRGKPGDDTGL